MAQTRVDPLDCARLIVLGCMQRDLYKTSHTPMAIRVATILLMYERSQNGSQIASPNQPSLPTIKAQLSVPERPWMPRSVALAIFSILSCVAVVTWLIGPAIIP